MGRTVRSSFHTIIQVASGHNQTIISNSFQFALRFARHPDVWELTLRQGAVDKVDGNRSFADSRGHALHITGANIANRKHVRKARFQHLWRTSHCPRRGSACVVQIITHAAGISSTGDPELDALLPFDEPYRISEPTALAISKARARGGRIIAIGTTVVRALEDAAEFDGSVRVGEGLATHRIGTNGRLHVVNAILSGTHEPGTGHYDLLRAFIDDTTLRRVDHELDAGGYRTHEFGDSVYIERKAYANTQEHAYRITWRVHRGARLFEHATAVCFTSRRSLPVLSVCEHLFF